MFSRTDLPFGASTKNVAIAVVKSLLSFVATVFTTWSPSLKIPDCVRSRDGLAARLQSLQVQHAGIHVIENLEPLAERLLIDRTHPKASLRTQRRHQMRANESPTSRDYD